MGRTVLLDLDGTLLPLAFETFFARYFERVCRFYEEELGVDLGPPFQAAAAVMLRNDGRGRNADVFWEAMARHVPCDRAEFERRYEMFLAREGATLGEGVVPDPAAARVVEAWRGRGATVVLATNPVFPRALIELRARWGALDPARFDLITAYETMSYCKPRPEYYAEVAAQVGVDPRECLMVGNDVVMDLEPAARVGMATCLVTGPHMVPGDGAFMPDHTCALDEVALLP